MQAAVGNSLVVDLGYHHNPVLASLAVDLPQGDNNHPGLDLHSYHRVVGCCSSQRWTLLRKTRKSGRKEIGRAHV